MKTNKTIASIYTALRANLNADGEAEINAKDVAKIIRVKLREAFPGTKFSVTSDYNSIRVRYENGPKQADVDAIVQDYSFGDFDGSIDLAYSSKNWMLPNGDMLPACCEGTRGSMGIVPSYATDCPAPGAIIVKYGPKYIFTSRDVSDEIMQEAVRDYMSSYGLTYDESRRWYDQVADNGMPAASQLNRCERDFVGEVLSRR